ncbi:uncharacterized protein BJ171DRAFT_135065 [Polychytrium aggregatum]|uniref:uncharacterized protein n=1 Tax=Polychytrium aggregatum TaxID=110093 RepID=UPI0022FDE282|nr:uncharacterized protein BJ171DRAFT_135065 [Polychytrium aggregatum]KAI9203916.1 hypothetical protein BJ171DRAFT_135065 [Polychytrium aggregatum]
MPREVIQIHSPLPTRPRSCCSLAEAEEQDDRCGNKASDEQADDEILEEIDRTISQQLCLTDALELIRTTKSPTEFDTLELRTAYNTIINSEVASALPAGPTRQDQAMSPSPSGEQTGTPLSPAADHPSHATNFHQLSFEGESIHDHDRRWSQIRPSQSRIGLLGVQAMDNLRHHFTKPESHPAQGRNSLATHAHSTPTNDHGSALDATRASLALTLSRVICPE